MNDNIETIHKIKNLEPYRSHFGYCHTDIHVGKRCMFLASIPDISGNPKTVLGVDNSYVIWKKR